MNSVSEIRHHIKVIDDTSKITRAMHLIASAKMKRAMSMHDKNLAFFNQVRSGIRFIFDTAGGPINNRFFRDHGRKAAYLVIAADKGLCGGYNQQVLKLALDTIQNSGHQTVKLFTVGHIGTDFFVRRGLEPDAHYQHVIQNPTLRHARRITAEMIELFLSKKVDEVYVIYTVLGSGGMLTPTVLRLMPLLPEDFAGTAPIHAKVAGFEFYPSPAAVAEATGGRGVDVILDVMGAKYLEPNVAALAVDGRLVVIGLQGGRKGTLDLNRLLTRRATVTATSLRFRPVEQKAEICRTVRDRVWPLIADGSIRPAPETRFAMADVADAHRHLASGANTGKVILVVRPD